MIIYNKLHFRQSGLYIFVYRIIETVNIFPTSF